MADPLVLALGGTRSGKSRWGLQRATTLAGKGGRVWFLATAYALIAIIAGAATFVSSQARLTEQV